MRKEKEERRIIQREKKMKNSDFNRVSKSDRREIKEEEDDDDEDKRE